MRVRFVTINLKGLLNNWFDQRFAALVDGLRPLAPDVVCFQEATVRHVGPLYHQSRAVADALGLQAVAFVSYGYPAEAQTQQQEGVAIASRWPIRGVRDRRLPLGAGDPPGGRVVLFATLMAPDGDVEVVTTHLSWEPEARAMRCAQMKLILDEFARSGWHTPGARAVLLGDINATEDEPVVKAATAYLRDVFREHNPDAPGYTWVRSNPHAGQWAYPDRRLDYVFCPPGVAIRRAELVLDRPTPVFPSDHFGVLADLEWDAD